MNLNSIALFRLITYAGVTAVLTLGATRLVAQATTPAATSIARLPERESDVAASRVIIGGLLGAVIGGVAGYEVARLGHEAFCEGTAQCAEYPRRGIREATTGGIVVGALVGVLVGYMTPPDSAASTSARWSSARCSGAATCEVRRLRPRFFLVLRSNRQRT